MRESERKHGGCGCVRHDCQIVLNHCKFNPYESRVRARVCARDSGVDMDVRVTIVASRRKRVLYTRKRALYTRKRALYTQKSPVYTKKPCILAKECVTIVASRRATATLLCVGKSLQVRECAREKKAGHKDMRPDCQFAPRHCKSILV